MQEGGRSWTGVQPQGWAAGSLSPPCPAGMRSWKRWQEPPSQSQAQHLGSSGADVTPRRRRLSEEGLISEQQHPSPRCRCSGIPPDPSFHSLSVCTARAGACPTVPMAPCPPPHVTELLRSLQSPPQQTETPSTLPHLKWVSPGPSVTSEGGRGPATTVAVVTVWLWPSWHCVLNPFGTSTAG